MRLPALLTLCILIGPLGACMNQGSPLAESGGATAYRATAVPATLTSAGRTAPASSLIFLGVN